MKLIEDLGLRAVGSQGYKKRYGLYECPICNKHFECQTGNVKNGATTKCRVCADKAISMRAEASFIEKAVAVHGDLYTYALFVYSGSGAKGIIQCNTCNNTFLQSPHAHLRGHGCPHCAMAAKVLVVTNASKIKLSKASIEFEEKAKTIHGGLYEYSLFVYDGNKTKGIIGCNTCHSTFEQTPNDHLSGHGCPSCAEYGFNKNKPAIIYYLKITHKDIVAYKIGITNRTVQERFSSTDLEKIKVVKTWDYLIGAEAYEEEQQILKQYKDYKYTGEPILSSGNTELFTVDILELPSSKPLQCSFECL